jgi:hypothetical protein
METVTGGAGFGAGEGSLDRAVGAFFADSPSVGGGAVRLHPIATHAVTARSTQESHRRIDGSRRIDEG